MGRFIANVDAIRARAGCHLLIVHHTGKDAARGARGWSGMRAAIDTEIEIRRGEIEVTKQRDLEGEWRCDFELVGTTLGVDSAGRSISSATVRLLGDPGVTRGETKVDAVSRERTVIAETAIRILDDQDSIPLAECWEAFGQAMREAGLVTTTVRHRVSEHVSVALCGLGVVVSGSAGPVRIRAVRQSSSEKSPWIIVRGEIDDEVHIRDNRDNRSGERLCR